MDYHDSYLVRLSWLGLSFGNLPQRERLISLLDSLELDEVAPDKTRVAGLRHQLTITAAARKAIRDVESSGGRADLTDEGPIDKRADGSETWIRIDPGTGHRFRYEGRMPKDLTISLAGRSTP